MYSHLNKNEENKHKSISSDPVQKQGENDYTDFVDNSPEAKQAAQLQAMADDSPEAKQAAQLQAMADNSPEAKEAARLQTMADKNSEAEQPIAPNKPNNTGLPDDLKTGIENLSGYSMDDVKVHYNSDKPAQLGAHAYAQGTDIYLASGQEKHLPHEAWHVVQQMQGRVKPTIQMEGNVNINDDGGLEKEADVMGAKALQIKLEENKSLQFGRNNIRNNDIANRNGDVVQLQSCVTIIGESHDAMLEVESNKKEKISYWFAALDKHKEDITDMDSWHKEVLSIKENKAEWLMAEDGIISVMKDEQTQKATARNYTELPFARKVYFIIDNLDALDNLLENNNILSQIDDLLKEEIPVEIKKMDDYQVLEKELKKFEGYVPRGYDLKGYLLEVLSSLFTVFLGEDPLGAQFKLMDLMPKKIKDNLNEIKQNVLKKIEETLDEADSDGEDSYGFDEIILPGEKESMGEKLNIKKKEYTERDLGIKARSYMYLAAMMNYNKKYSDECTHFIMGDLHRKDLEDMSEETKKELDLNLIFINRSDTHSRVAKEMKEKGIKTTEEHSVKRFWAMVKDNLSTKELRNDWFDVTAYDHEKGKLAKYRFVAYSGKFDKEGVEKRTKSEQDKDNKEGVTWKTFEVTKSIGFNSLEEDLTQDLFNELLFEKITRDTIGGVESIGSHIYYKDVPIKN